MADKRNGLRSLSISGKITLDMHSLNNEGTDGNHTFTRQVSIVHGNGDRARLATVNAISGDMLKHIQAEHLYHVATEEGLPLCSSCRTFDANRINKDTDFMGSVAELKSNEELLNRLLGHCCIDDTEGILITQGNRSLGRKSVVEFGWMVGIPELTRTETFFHVKYDPERRGTEGQPEGANVGQAIFHRPANSGVYAVVCNVEVDRVGLNDISQEYAVDGTERARRTRALLKSLLYTFVEPNGAHRNTQNPHILNFEGVVSLSRTSIPAPTVSALNDSYPAEIEGVAQSLNRMSEDSVVVKRFDSLNRFADIMVGIIEEVYALYPPRS